MKLLLLGFTLLLTSQCFAQISFLDSATTWEQLSRQAKKEKKLIFIHIEGRGCDQCNDVATQGFSSPVLKERFQKDFISTRVRIESKNGTQLAGKFGLTHPLVSLFVNADGNVLNRFNGSSSSGEVYLQQADIAIGRLKSKPLEAFEKEYNAGERSSQFMRAYITRQLELGKPADKLLDEYAGTLNLDSLQNFQIIKFIYQSGPTLDSRIYKVIQAATPRKVIDSLYKTVPYPEAVAINNAIIGNSFHKAVQTKNQELAYQTAVFTQGTFKPNYTLGNIAFQRSMLRYSLAVRDTMSYMQQVSQFLNFTHMLMSVDSLKRMDADHVRRFTIANDSVRKSMMLKTMQFAPPSQYFHMEMNEHAWHFYEMSDKKGELEKALMWSKRSLEWFDELTKGTNHPMALGNPAYLDTYAHLLYKLGQKEEAIKWQTKAVEAGKVAKQRSPNIEEALVKMKARTL
ncbi:thioredoxin family protein [Dyadobacter psychrophilus]|uniref:Thioredoxin-like n=1 Tax=Dyadobacter psychrophilus TaxID=651661 RepID=A0A1T5EBX5_9BACT|nr:thioredoxin family protein [Dyadobacter psychrophilus]SKB81423.1 Thioredoxin-like [Dyadobacter psychrophilus]